MHPAGRPAAFAVTVAALVLGAGFAVVGRPGLLVAALVVVAAWWGPEVPRWYRSSHPRRDTPGAWRRTRRRYAVGAIVGGLAATTGYPLAWRANGVAARGNGQPFRHDPGYQLVMGALSLFGGVMIVIGVVELVRTRRR